jgi:3-methylfumaryl-CoA hydratase
MSESFENWIGKSVTREDVITQRLQDEYRSTLSPYLFQPKTDDECPPGLHWCVALPRQNIADLGADGAEAKGVFLPPVPLPRRMWAGGQIETFKPLRVGDNIRRVSTISDVKSRQGKTGALCFISVVHEIFGNGALSIRERHDILYREASTESAQAKPPADAPKGELEWRVEATPLLLFRFSSVTFNGHRIHYDLPYAQKVEGYGGLLVHGPMQAALTLNQLSTLRGQVPRVFDYRCVSPLIAEQTFRVLSNTESSLIVNAAGVVTIEAKAH